MKESMMILFAMVLIVAITVTAEALTVTDRMISDDFNDGVADGWWLGYNPNGDYGNWQIENGTLVQDKKSDWYPALKKRFLSINERRVS